MDVWLQGWGLAALWVGAVALVLILCFVWAIWVKVERLVLKVAPTTRDAGRHAPAGGQNFPGPESQP